MAANINRPPTPEAEHRELSMEDHVQLKVLVVLIYCSPGQAMTRGAPNTDIKGTAAAAGAEWGARQVRWKLGRYAGLDRQSPWLRLLSHCRLKDLLSQRLMECGWVEEVKERMQGQSISHTCPIGLSLSRCSSLGCSWQSLKMTGWAKPKGVGVQRQ